MEFKAILYIIIGIIWLIYNHYRKAQAKNTSWGESMEPTDNKDYTLPDERIDSKSNSLPKTQHSFDNKPVIKEQSYTIAPASSQVFKTSAEEIIQEPVSLEMVTEQEIRHDQDLQLPGLSGEIQKEGSNEELVNTFDLRQAIIYSEILKRPQY